MKNYALFSVSGRFIGFTNFKPVTGLYKEMPDTFDPVYQVYVGDYETGSLKNITELQPKDYREANVDKKWRVFETEMNEDTFRHITQELNYPLFKQLNIISECLYANKDKLALTNDFIKMAEKIKEVRDNMSTTFESYKQAPKAEIITKDKEREFYEYYNQRHLNIFEDQAPSKEEASDK